MSAGTGPNPFSRTSGMTQTADQTKAVSGFYGNIDFDKESTKIDFRKSQGKDLNVRNPYIEREVSAVNMEDLKSRIIEACRNNSAANGLRAFR